MFAFKSSNEQVVDAVKACEALNAQQNETALTTSIAFVTLAENGAIDDVTATEHTSVFSPWVSGTAYLVGALRQYENELYRCVQSHTAQEDWTPNAVPALWVKVGNPAEEYPVWTQPIGVQDAYAIGDKVTHNDSKWISTVDANVWEPGVYGWEEEEIV